MRCDLRDEHYLAIAPALETEDVYQGAAEPQLGAVEPLIFVSNLKVNTDGTRVPTNKINDPRALKGAINNIRNAMHKGFTISDFEKVAAQNWEPVLCSLSNLLHFQHA